MNYFTKEQLEDITNSILSNPVVETLKELYNKYSDKKIEEVVVEEPVNNIENIEVQESNQEGIAVEEAPSAPVVSNTIEAPMPDVESSQVMPSDPLENTVNIPILGVENNVVNTPKEPVVSPIPSVIESPAVESIPNAIEPPVSAPLPASPVLESTPITPMPNFINNTPEVSNTEIPAASQPTFTIPSFNVPEVNVPDVNKDLNMNNNQNLNINSNPFNSPVFGGNLWETPTSGVNNLMQTTDNFNAPEDSQVSVAPVEQAPNVPFFGGPTEAVNNPIPVQEKPQNYGPTMFGQFEQNYRG